MSDPILGLTDPKRFFPKLRRVIADISRPALRQWQQLGQRNIRRSAGAIAAWCADNFSGPQATFHYLRIQRRLKHFSVMLVAKFRLTDARYVEPPRTPGMFLYRGIKKHRMPTGSR